MVMSFTEDLGMWLELRHEIDIKFLWGKFLGEGALEARIMKRMRR
jgi:hypothetical protein